jgi:hypothetical protein
MRKNFGKTEKCGKCGKMRKNAGKMRKKCGKNAEKMRKKCGKTEKLLLFFGIVYRENLS